MARPFAQDIWRQQAATSEWTSGPQSVPHPLGEQAAGIGIFAGAAAGLHFLGKHKFGDVTGYDLYLRGIRAAEEYSPGRVLRTFQLSYLFSPLETQSQAYRYFSKDIIAGFSESAPTRQWADYISRLIGKDITSDPRILKEGFRFEEGKLLLGKTSNEVLLARAGIIRNPILGDPKFPEAYARSLFGGPVRKGAFSVQIPYLNKTGKTLWESISIVGGHSKPQAMARYMAGYGTSLVERFNQLARAPFELPIISGILNKIPIVKDLRLDVKPSSGLKTLGALTWRLGVLAPLAYTAYQQLDWTVRQIPLLDDTVLAEGTTAAAATIWTEGNILASKAAEVTGGHALREWQEEVAPGSTDIARLLAFPIMGGLGGIGLGFAHRAYSQISLQATAGIGAHEASSIHKAATKFFQANIYGTEVASELLESLPIEFRALAQDKAEKWTKGLQGKAARFIADRQNSKGVVGGLLRQTMKKASLSRMLGWTGFAAGLAMVAPFLPGALVPSERPERLEKIYSGEEEVPIRKGRWWEFGRSPWEGGRIERFRPHWYPRMLANAKDISIYGEDISPISKWWKENLTYDIERQNYYSRPYPVTGTFGEDIPFLGPLIAATLGKALKPPMYMHTEEWAGDQGVKRMPLGYGERAEISELGELPPGEPLSPYDATGAAGEQAYRMTEMVGLPGFIATSIKEKLTGSQDLFDQEMRLQSARKMYGAERSYWDLELGGMAGTSELIRRLYPHERRQIPQYNPIENTMPSWLPGPGDKSPDFRHGDPFVKIPEGELRLPGTGYAALHPELEGIAPENYPDIWKLKILADVAPYSEKYGRVLGRVRAMRNADKLSEQELQMYDTIIEQIKEKKNKKEFFEYQYRGRARTSAEEALARINDAYKERGERAGVAGTMLGSYWETIAHGAETPLDYLTPVAPGAKLVHMRTAIEDYAKSNLYGTQSAFWQRPISNFLRPFAYSTAHSLGWEGIPKHEQRRRDIEQYFDVLKWVKFTRLKRLALQEDDMSAAQEYESKRRETLFGINPFTRNYSHIFRALPRRERDYFNAFAKADLEERQEILNMIPENEKSLMVARWKMEDVTNWQKAIKKEALTSAEEEQAQAEIDQLYEDRRTEGFPVNKDLWIQYKATREANEDYADWYRRTQLLPQILAGRDLPGPDYVGFDPRVRLEDIKLKVIQNLGESPFDYDIWPDDVRAAARRPYLDQAAAQLYDEQLDTDEVQDRLKQLLSSNGIVLTSIVSSPVYGGQRHEIDLAIEEDRTSEARDIIRRRGLN